RDARPRSPEGEDSLLGSLQSPELPRRTGAGGPPDGPPHGERHGDARGEGADPRRGQHPHEPGAAGGDVGPEEPREPGRLRRTVAFPPSLPGEAGATGRGEGLARLLDLPPPR